MCMFNVKHSRSHVHTTKALPALLGHLRTDSIAQKCSLHTIMRARFSINPVAAEHLFCTANFYIDAI